MEINEQHLLERAEKVRDMAKIYRDHVFAEEIISKRSKTFLAKLKMEVRKSLSGKISDTELETRALSTETWKEFDEKNQKALLEAGRSEIDYKVAMVEYEAMRSALSSRKAEVKSFGG